MAELQKATLGGGCFWCLEAIYDDMQGVESVESGYMGGSQPNPSYKDVCTGSTGHVEVVQVTFDPAETSFEEILEVFFATHDPTTWDRQGNDVGSQYRSVVFYHSDEQRKTTEEMIRRLGSEGIWKDPIVTEVRPATTFYEAEDYHQEYLRNNPNQPYCMFVVSPKLAKFRAKFAGKRKGAVRS